MNPRLIAAICWLLFGLPAKAQGPSAPFDRLERRAVSEAETSSATPKELVALLGSARAKANGRIALHPSEEIIASAEYYYGIGLVRIWNAKTLERIAILRGHSQLASDVAFSPNGRLLATVARDKTVRIWKVSRQEGDTSKTLGYSFQHAVTLRDHKDRVHSVAFSPDGKLMATGEVTGRAILWSVRASAVKKLVELPSPLPGWRKKAAVAFSPDSRRLAIGFLLETMLWDVTSDRPQRLATLRPKTGKLKRTLNDFPSVVESLAFSPNGRWLAVGRYNSGGVRLWDMKGDLKRESAFLDGHTTRTVVFSPDGKSLYSGGTRSGHIWDVDSLKLRKRFIGRQGMAPLRDGRTLISTFTNSTMHRLDVSGPEVRELAPIRPHESVGGLRISKDGRTIVSGGAAIRFWNVGTSLTLGKTVPLAGAISLTPKSHQIVVANQLGVALWDTSKATPKQLRQIGGPVKDQILSLVVSPNGRYLAMTVRWGANLKLWDLHKKESLNPIASVKEYGGIVGFSPDGKTLATGHIHYKRVSVWDLSEPSSPRLKYQINNATMSTDGRWIATADDKGLIRIWELGKDQAKRLRQFKFRDGPVNTIAFDRKRQRLAVSYGSYHLVVALRICSCLPQCARQASVPEASHEKAIASHRQ